MTDRVEKQILLVEAVTKTYGGGEAPVEALRGVSLKLGAGDFVAVMGSSGCGKSTLLHLCGAMDRPTSGRVALEGVELGRCSDDRLTRLRRERIGFVFQFFNLLPTLTVQENIALPLLLDHQASGQSEERARDLASRVGLGHRLRHYPQQLSGGEMQRTAVARAMIHQPALLIADEPTGNLDSENGNQILGLLSQLNRDQGVTILMATHAEEAARFAARRILLRDGRIERTINRAPVPESSNDAAL